MPREDKPDRPALFFRRHSKGTGNVTKNQSIITMLNHLRMLLLAFAISCISAVAVVPPEVSLLSNADSIQNPPPGQLTTTTKEYIATTPYNGENIYLYREHFYDFNGDGSFSIMPDRAYDAPVLTTIFPDGRVYGIDNMGHRMIRYNNTAYDVLFDDGYQGGKSLVPFDYNNDGKYDFKYGDNVYTIDNAGNLNLDALTLLTPGQYEGVRSELKLSTGGEGVPGMGDHVRPRRWRCCNRRHRHLRRFQCRRTHRRNGVYEQ